MAQINTVDLPEPKPVKLSHHELTQRRWRFYQNINVFLLAYAFLHKVIIHNLKHFDLLWTLKNNFFVLFHLLLIPVILKQKVFWCQQISIMGVVYCVVNLLMSFKLVTLDADKINFDHVSIWMTEGLSLVYLILFLKFLNQITLPNKRISILILIFATCVSWFSLKFKSHHHHAFNLKSSHGQTAHTRKAYPSGCGQNNYFVDTTYLNKLRPSHRVQILKCGFEHSVALVVNNFSVLNQELDFLNLRIQKQSNRRWTFVKNIALYKGSSFSIDSSLLNHGVLKIQSDSFNAGVLLLVPYAHKDQITLDIEP